MAFGNSATIVGNVTRDPELSYSKSGTAICRVGLAWNKFVRDGDDIPHYFDVTAFGQLAENVAESVSKGDRIVIDGQADFSSWTVEVDGEEQNRNKVGFVADDIAISLRFATVPEIVKNPRKGGDQGPGPMPPGEEPDAEGEPF